MNGLNLFGFIPVSLMLLAYMLEEKNLQFIILFACAGAIDSPNGLLQGT